MSKNCAIMTRMKKNYENRSKTFLTKRVPVIMRLDGKAFHTYTNKLIKPFDEGLIEDMADTAISLCSKIQGAKCAYVQSDEISILITDYDKLASEAWFDYNVQKMTSVSASMASGKFNQLRVRRNVFLGLREQFYNEFNTDCEIAKRDIEDKLRSFQLLTQSFNDEPLADFDSRVANYPKEEVANYFLARQKDAVKNSIAMMAQSLYSPDELKNKNQSMMQDMIHEKGLNWNDLHFSKKRGTFIIKNKYINGISIEAKNKNGNNVIERFPDTGNYALFNEQTLEWEDIINPIIRTKWESVETPFSFNETNFKNWI